MAIPRRNEKIELFTDYILETYISKKSNFPLLLWSEYSAIILRELPIAVRNFILKSMLMIYSTHLNIFVFIG